MADAGSTDPRAVEQGIQKGAWELRKLENEVRAAEVKAAIPDIPELKPGSIDAGDRPSPIAVLGAYRGLDALAVEIVSRCKKADLAKVRVVSTDVGRREQRVHETVASAMALVDEDLGKARGLLTSTDKRTVLPIPLMAIASAVSAALPALFSLLESNTIVRSSDVTIPFGAAAASVAGALRRSQLEVAIGTTGVPTSFQLTKQVRRLERVRHELILELATYRLATASEAAPATDELALLHDVVVERSKIESGFDAVTKLVGQHADAAAAVRSAKAALAAREAVAAVVQTIIDATGTALQAITTVSGESSLLDIAESYSDTKEFATLILTPTYAGAESVYEEVPVKRDRGLHVGTAVLSFVLMSPDGAVLDAGTIHRQVAGVSEMGRAGVTWQD